MTKKQKFILAIIIVVVVLGAVYYFGFRSGKTIKLPNSGNGIPQGWTAQLPVQKLINAMDGVGTDESAIFQTLEYMTDDQLAAIINEYYNQKKEDLIDRLNEELSGEDLDRALAYFKNLSM